MEINRNRLIAIDVETTGLSPTKDHILEVALIILDNDLEELAALEWISPASPRSVTHRLNREPFVLEMHKKSGLWDAYTNMVNAVDPGDLDALAYAQELRALTLVNKFGARNAPLLGSNVGFDRAFIQKRIPGLHEAAHYRNIDVSSIAELAHRWAPEIAAGAPVKTRSHRAMDDIRESITELRYYRDCGLFVEWKAVE